MRNDMFRIFTGTVCIFVALCSTAYGTTSEVMVQTPTMQRALTTVDGTLKTTGIQNRLTGKVLQTRGPEFVITYADGQTVTSDDFELRTLDRTETGAIAKLHNAALSLTAEITYTGGKQLWAYKQIQFINTGKEALLLRTVELEHLKVAGEKITFAVKNTFPHLSDWGQPVYTESLWIGAEFPATKSSVTEDGYIFLRHHPGFEIAPGESYQTKRAVMGGAESGKANVKQSFMDYVATLPQKQPAPQMSLYWNGYLIVNTRTNYSEGVLTPSRIDRAQKQFDSMKRMKEETGFNFSSFTYDVPFYRNDGLFVPMEPDTWKKTSDALASIGTDVGFWASFSCIYTSSTHDWGKTQGYELQHNRAYCLAGPIYYAAIKKRMEDIVREHNMASVNFDGMYWGQGVGCNEPGHGHLVGKGDEAGVFSTERVVENELAIYESLREINPEILIDFFVCAEWASPWWLVQVDGVHTVVGDTVAAGIPSPWVRDELITVRDIQVFEEHRRVERQFPLWAEDLYGTQVRADTLIDNVFIKGEAYSERWEDEFVMALPGRGATAVSLISGDMPTLEESRGGLKFLGEVANWTKANEGIYSDYRLIGGEPKDRELYGYSHGDSKGRAVVVLRNPFINAEDYPLVLDESLGLTPTDEKLYVNVVYPYRKTYEKVSFGAKVKIPAQDYAVMMLEVLTESRQLKELTPAGRWTVDESNSLVVLDESVLDETPKGRLTLKSRDGAFHLEGDVTVPSTAVGGQIQLMLGTISGNPVTKPVVLIDGKEVEVIFHERLGEVITQNWALINVPVGKHAIDIELVCSTLENEARIGAWLVANYKLTGQVTDQQGPEVGRPFPVYNADEDRRMTKLFAPTDLTLPFRFDPIPEGQSVYVSDMRGRCTETQVGDMVFGWDHSSLLWYASAVRIKDKLYDKGIAFHAPGLATFDIDGQFKRFVADVGMLDMPKPAKFGKVFTGTSEFIVEGDGKELFRSAVMTEGDSALPISVDISGVKILTLRSSDGGDGLNGDHVTWGDARVER